MIYASKIYMYKKNINREFKAYQEGIVGKIRKLESTDPKLFWSILNRCESSKQKINDIAVDSFFGYFRNLNGVVGESDFSDLSPEEITHLNTDLDEPILESEILKAINSLKSNKACSDDLILN